MSDVASTLVALQQADSFFPSGGFVFSWGLEGLAADGVVRTPADVGRFLSDQLHNRWATSDRVALVAAYRAGDDLPRIAEVDETVHASALPQLIRDGSERAGTALLSVHVHLGTPQAADYRDCIAEGRAIGHLPIVQGLVWRNLGLTETQAAAIAAYGFAVNVLSAALRLGLIGHLGAQRSLAEARSTIATLLDSPPPPLDQLGSYAPLADIASMHQQTADSRLFAN